MEELIKLLKKKNIQVLASTVFTNNPKNQIEQLKVYHSLNLYLSIYQL